MSNYKKLRNEIPKNIDIMVVTKGRTREQILEVIKEGANILGGNYVNEVKKLDIGGDWWFIGHLQKDNVSRAIKLFNVITVDSFEIAHMIDYKTDHKIKLLIEVNSGSEENKNGVLPKHATMLAAQISFLKNVELIGLMTMGKKGNERECFRITKQLYDDIKKIKPLSVLSMGMSDSYKIAVEEGATQVRLGRIIFQ